MEVATATTPNGRGASGGMSPFHDHDVREWSRIDSLTGDLERARIETDRWSADTINSSHKYGKVVDSLARTDADGGLQHAAHRQLEIFHSQVPGGRLQVIKTQAVSKWTSNKTIVEQKDAFKTAKEFENLQLSLNPLDLSPQKSKASILRSVSRRPPTRQRPKEPPPIPNNDDLSDSLRHVQITAATNLQRVSRLCHKIHETAVRQAFGRKVALETSPTIKCDTPSTTSTKPASVKSTPPHTNLRRTKSSSSEEINNESTKDSTNKSIEDLEDLEQLQTWRRTSKLRRSLQLPKNSPKQCIGSKPIDLQQSSVSVKKIKEELEKGRRLNTALRNNNVDLDALDQILQSISSGSEKNSEDLDNETNKKQKKNSFVTVESIQEVKGRLRRTSSPTNDIYKINGKDEDTDDGIVTEESSFSDNKMSSHSSYIYNGENNNKQSLLGTGSLESRVKLSNGNATRNEDWYNRRKSYGFERVHNQEEAPGSIPLNRNNKKMVESSTDSGICRSTEIVVVPTNYNFEHDESLEVEGEGVRNGIQTGQVKKLASTFSQLEQMSSTTKQLLDPWSKFSKNDNIKDWPELKSTTITIPIAKNNNVIDLSWNGDIEKEAKRHSIAVDESKYVTTSKEEKFRRTSLALNEPEDINGNRKTKKVEFCKTEVHFAADSGKVNIVATDEKPPPTQNFRRRRRNSGPSLEEFNKNGLPVLHFGDTSDEKCLFGTAEEALTGSIYENLVSRVPPAFGLVTVNTTANNHMEIMEEEEEDKKELTENEIKGILKNKPIKPRPYHLGENVLVEPNSSDQEENKWGVRLRHVEKTKSPPIWKSTVTVRNYYEKQGEDSGIQQPEFQKLLKSLRPTVKKESQEEKMQKVEISKGYSTKINFGEGQATVIQQNERHPTWPRTEPASKDIEKPTSHQPSFQIFNRYSSPPTKSFASPIQEKPPQVDLNKAPEKLSSPFLVYKTNNTEQKDKKDLSGKHFKTTVDKKLQTKHLSEGIVLRQPKKSEMTYFGVNVSPKPVKKFSRLTEKDIITPQDQEMRPIISSSPIYENLKTNKYAREIDSSILEELTKAADQILQAVNGYTDEIRQTSDEEDSKKVPLETIQETKFWKQQSPPPVTKIASISNNTAKTAKLKATSSTSSIESLSKSKITTKTAKKKLEKGEHTRANTKARRLQRASSREALLQSHGSSSEDLPAKAEVPVRKPRTVKKTKVTQLTMINGPEIKKSTEMKNSHAAGSKVKTKEETIAKEERILGSLSEIRHKTAVSTIRSTSEKAARDRLKQKNEEIRRRNGVKKELSKVSSSTSQSLEKEKKEAATTSRQVSSGAISKEAVTQHRISTANIKKCYRSDGTVRH